MLTCTVVVAVPTLLVVVVCVVAAVVVGGGAVVPTANLPCMPRRAWPVTVQTYENVPFFPNFTVSSWLRPGASSFVDFPAILKLWPILPLLVTLKTTVVPTGTERFESLNDHSFATTLIVTFDACAVVV